MSNTQGLCDSFKLQLLNGGHNFGSTNTARTANTPDVFKAALYYATASINNTTTTYTTVGEVTGVNYTAGGLVIPNITVPLLFTDSATWTPSGSLTWNALTITLPFDTILIYNATQGNAAVSVHTFGAQTITAGTFALAMPSPGSSTSLLIIA